MVKVEIRFKTPLVALRIDWIEEHKRRRSWRNTFASRRKWKGLSTTPFQKLQRRRSNVTTDQRTLKLLFKVTLTTLTAAPCAAG